MVFLKKQISYITLIVFSLLLVACSTTEEDQKFGYTVGNADSGAVVTEENMASTKRIRTVFAKLKPFAMQALGEQQVEFSLTVVKNDDTNAWTSSNGNITFYTGLVDKLQLTNAELAAIMGHEMAHVILDHASVAEEKTASSNALMDVGAIAINMAAGVDLTEVLDVAKKYAVNQPLSRELETQADETGLLLMARAGYDPNSALTLWNKLDNAEGGTKDGLQALLSSHPSNGNREEHLQQLMPVAQQLYAKAKIKQDTQQITSNR